MDVWADRKRRNRGMGGDRVRRCLTPPIPHRPAAPMRSTCWPSSTRRRRRSTRSPRRPGGCEAGRLHRAARGRRLAEAAGSPLPAPRREPGGVGRATRGAAAGGAGFRIIGAHTDSPNLRVKPRPDTGRAGWRQLGVEVYGGVLLNSWLDRDLGLSGRVAVPAGAGAADAPGPRRPAAAARPPARHPPRPGDQRERPAAQPPAAPGARSGASGGPTPGRVRALLADADRRGARRRRGRGT